jgi:hypothetical protein
VQLREGIARHGASVKSLSPIERRSVFGRGEGTKIDRTPKTVGRAQQGKNIRRHGSDDNTGFTGAAFLSCFVPIAAFLKRACVREPFDCPSTCALPTKDLPCVIIMPAIHPTPRDKNPLEAHMRSLRLLVSRTRRLKVYTRQSKGQILI